MDTFFVIYFPDPFWQAVLDMMRLVCNPSTKSPAHITVRGPYASEPSYTKAWRARTGIRIKVDGVSSFVSSDQTTVFLRCYSSDIEDLFWKPDYPNSIPHITIYDGKSIEFAHRIADTLKSAHWSYWFTAEKLERHKATHQLPLISHWISDAFNAFLLVRGKPITLPELVSMSEDERITSLRDLTQALSRHQR